MRDQLLPILTDADANASEYTATNSVTLACREGCDYCCYLRVDISYHEASFIVEYIRDNFTEKQIADLRGQLKKHVDLVDDMTAEQHEATNVQCPLLVDSRCSVYPARPINCRAYTSLDVQSCEYSFNNPHDMNEKRPTDPRLDDFWAHAKRQIQNLGSGSYGQDLFELGWILLSQLNRELPSPAS